MIWFDFQMTHTEVGMGEKEKFTTEHHSDASHHRPPWE